MDDKTLQQCIICNKSTELKRCSKCNGVFYCSRDHQIQDWPNHKMTCSLAANKKEKNGTLVHTKSEEKQETDTEFYDFDQRPLLITQFRKPASYDPSYLSKFANEYLRKNGFCIIDGILPENKCSEIKTEIQNMYSSGILKTGKLAGGQTSGVEEQKVVNKHIRSDEMAWINGNETERFPCVCEMIENTMDVIVTGLNSHSNGEFCIHGKTKAMVACYPGNKTSYRRHVDNPSGDGRLVTCIVYMNENWDCEKKGGNLRVFPTSKDGSESSKYFDIEPKMNRLLLFWSDNRTPHEVQPAFEQRYAITIWYFDKNEREMAKKTEELNKNVEALQLDVSMIELKKKETERMLLEQKIQNEAAKAVQALSEDEMEALCSMVSQSSKPKEALKQLGIGEVIQDHLLKEINIRLGKS